MPNTKCSNCQHWTRCETYPNPEADSTANIGTCAHIATDTEPIESDKPKKGSTHTHKALFVHEDFACLYFVQKQADTNITCQNKTYHMHTHSCH